MVYDKRIKMCPPNIFRAVLKSEHINYTESEEADKIVFDFDRSTSIIFNISNPLTVLDTRQFADGNIVDVDSDDFYNIVLAYLYINRGIDKVGIKHMATYLIKRYSKTYTRSNNLTSVYENSVKDELVETAHTASADVEVTYLRFVDVYDLIIDVLNHNPVASFDRMIKRDVYVLFSKQTKLGFKAKRDIVLEYIGMARMNFSVKLISATINELIEQDRMLKITTGRISAKSNLSSTTVRNRTTTELSEILKTHNEYRVINTEHSFNKFKEFLEKGAVNETAISMCGALSISRSTYFQYKALANSLSVEELGLIKTLEY